MHRVIVLDSYHLGDPLFVRQFARHLTDLAEPTILVHGSAEAGERALEAEGALAKREEGVLGVSSDAERQSIERATRGLNRQIVDQLTEEGVATFRCDCTSRGLLELGSDGRIHKVVADWLWDLAAKKVVPVVAALAADPGDRIVEINAGYVAAALAGERDDAVVNFLVTGPGRSVEGGGALPTEALAPVSEELAAAQSEAVTIRFSHPRRIDEVLPHSE